VLLFFRDEQCESYEMIPATFQGLQRAIYDYSPVAVQGAPNGTYVDVPCGAVAALLYMYVCMRYVGGALSLPEPSSGDVWVKSHGCTDSETGDSICSGLLVDGHRRDVEQSSELFRGECSTDLDLIGK